MKPRLGLMVQLFFLIVLPLAGLLVVVSFGSVLVHQAEMRQMVGERDVIAVRAAADALRAEIQRHESAVRTLVALPLDAATFIPQSILAHADFDLGLALVDADGEVITQSDWSALLAGPGALVPSLRGGEQLQIVTRSDDRPAALAVAQGAIARQSVVGAFSLDPLFAQVSRQIMPANPLPARDVMSAAISPNGDEDYFSLGNYNSLWGVIALLDTQSGTTDPPATLVMLRNNGSTELGRDVGSWVNGSGLAFVPFLDESLPHFFRVYEEGGDATIADYTLRLYPTFFTTQPEVESNDSFGTATITAPTMAGTLGSLADVDCFSSHGFALESFVFALDGDPNDDGSQFDMALEVRNSSNVVIASANHTGGGGTEFLEVDP
jgi:hypothetical protein